VIAHWDEVERARVDWRPAAAGWWTDLGRAAGSVGVGLRLMDVDPGRLSVPVHIHSREEEVVFVLAGAGWSWQGEKKHPIGTGDCIVYAADTDPHALEAGDGGLRALVFGTREQSDISYLPRTGRGHVGRFWFEITWGERPEEDPAEAPMIDSVRPPNIVQLDAVVEGDEDGAWAELGRAAGALRTGLNWVRLPPGRRAAPPHCHSAEEEIFVVLDGDGVLELWPTPAAHRLRGDVQREDHVVGAGHVVSRPPATRIAHSLRAGDGRLTYLAYGTREPSDVCYYPRSNKIFWRGVGLIARLEPLDYDDGEADD